MKTETKHTPGPWTYHTEDPSGEWVLVMARGKAGQIVANVNTESCPDAASAPCFRKMPAEANAKLICAAPELLEACKLALSIVHLNGSIETAEQIQAAIAKAEGSI